MGMNLPFGQTRQFGDKKAIVVGCFIFNIKVNCIFKIHFKFSNNN